jgi:hypothetical protein
MQAKKEMTLDCSMVLQSRVIPVRSYYLTSLATSLSLAFVLFGKGFVLF